MKKILPPLLIHFILLIFIVIPVKADGIIIPDPPPIPPDHPISAMKQLEIQYHHVDVKIVNQIAITHVDQVFHNPNDWPVEGTYVFPVPADAGVSSFVLWIDGEPVSGEILDADEARQTYEEIVRELKDPALLEYVGQGALKASIFPIEPGENRRIEIEYQQVLAADHGLVRYVYPLNTEKFSMQPLESVRISIDVQDAQAIRSVYSPTHPIDVSQHDDFSLAVGYEESDVIPEKDFALYYSIGENKALHLLSYRDPSDIENLDGFFLLLLAASPQEQNEVVSKDVLLILDRSGSMEGEKFRQAQSALIYILQHLNPGDRFYITAFSTHIETFSDRLLPVSEANKAITWTESLSAAGSTDINRALLETIKVADQERPAYVVFLTDGLPTEGVTDSAMILSNINKESQENIRLFPFGVGYDVDTFLLDSLSSEHHGLSTYVKPGEPLDEVLSTFYSRISTPVLTNLELDFDGVSVYDLYPEPLPDLFKGSQIILAGRYRGGGDADITLTGRVNGEKQVFQFRDYQFVEDNAGENNILASLPRLWAARKIGYLMNLVRLQGPTQETIDQIVRLSIRYGIITPYTSYLVTEPMPIGEENQADLARDVFEEALAAPAEVSGKQAVEKADQEGELSQAEIAPTLSQEYTDVKATWSRMFVLRDGIWLDSAYDPDVETIKVGFLSDEYFQLVNYRADVAAALALGDHIILLVNGTAYEITPDETTSSDFRIQARTPNHQEEQQSGYPVPSTVSTNSMLSLDQTDIKKEPLLSPKTVIAAAGIGMISAALVFAFLTARNLLHKK